MEPQQYKNFAQSLNLAENKRFEILDIEKTADELKIILGISEPRLFHTCVHFKGVIGFDFYTFGGEDWYRLPQLFNSFTFAVNSQNEELYNWRLLGDGTEWTFIALYPRVSVM